MLPSGKGAIPLFKAFGIQVWLHWSWFLVAAWQIQQRLDQYQNHALVWAVWQYLGLFGIVLLHEFGHSLASRSVGGSSEEIILWPFGGIAFVQVPPRPGALLWSIAAGPLVNVVLVPVFFLAQILVARNGLLSDSADARHLLDSLASINLLLLTFNILPIYPLDGGQILQALLWFKVGQRKSLLIASALGLVGGIGLAIYGFADGNYWLGGIALFLISLSWNTCKSVRAWQKPGLSEDKPAADL